MMINKLFQKANIGFLVYICQELYLCVCEGWQIGAFKALHVGDHTQIGGHYSGSMDHTIQIEFMWSSVTNMH